MPEEAAFFLNRTSVREALRIAWLDSNPGIMGGHEKADSSSAMRLVCSRPFAGRAANSTVSKSRGTSVAESTTGILWLRSTHIRTPGRIFFRNRVRPTSVPFATIPI